MNINSQPPTPWEWSQLTYWQRKRFYYRVRWEIFKINWRLFKSKIKKIVNSWTVRAKAFLQKRP